MDSPLLPPEVKDLVGLDDGGDFHRELARHLRRSLHTDRPTSTDPAPSSLAESINCFASHHSLSGQPPSSCELRMLDEHPRYQLPVAGQQETVPEQAHGTIDCFAR